MDRKRQKLSPGKTKKKLKLATPDPTSHQSNLNFNCNKEVVIQLERLSESVVPEMTAGWSALPPEQTKKKLKLSTPKTKLHPSNPHFICDKEVVIQLDKLSDSFVAELTAGGPALPLEQTKKKLKLSTTDTTSHQSNNNNNYNLNFNCNKEVVIQIERLSESVVAEMTAGWSALPPEQVIAELEQVKEERARDKINFETEKCELESKINKYKEQCTELQSEKEKLRNENKKLQSENENVQSENEKLQSENKRLQKRLQDLESSNINVEEKSQMNLYNTDLNRQITKVNERSDDALDINAMPNEIILKVFSYLTQNQLGQIAGVCRRWNVLTKSPGLWRKVNVKIFSYVWEKNAKEQRDVVKSFIDGLPSCVTFIRLDFQGFAFFKMDFEELCGKLHQNCPYVEDLILTNLTISNLLSEVINFCTQFLQCVKKLVFLYCHFSKSSKTVELNDNSKIEVLDLYRCDISRVSKTQFSKLLYLKELRLAVANVDDTWFVDYASFLNRLHVLNLGWTYITASTFLAIQRHGHNLKELYLCDFKLLDHDLNFNKSTFPHLKTICLGSYDITHDVVLSLIQSCPSLENVYVNERVAGSFAAHPLFLANRCKLGIVKALKWDHNHNIDYSHN